MPPVIRTLHAAPCCHVTLAAAPRVVHRDFERLRHFMGCYHADVSHASPAPLLATAAVVVGALVQSALTDLRL